MIISDVRRWRLSLFAFMFIAGVAMASWVTRVPAIKGAVEASTAQMGLILLGVSVGSMAGILSSGWFVSRVGTRPVIIVGGSSIIAGIATIGAGAAFALSPAVFLGFALFGLGSGLAEIALNVDGAEVEARLDRSVLPALHGCFSLGSLFGAVIGIAVTAAGLPVVWHLGGSATALAVVALWASRGLSADIGRAAAPSPSDVTAATPARAVWRDPALLLLGVVLLGIALAEGSAADWLPLIVADDLGLSQTLGSVSFAAFALVMTIGRFSGHALIAVLGTRGVLLSSILTAAVGIAMVALVDQTALVIVGIALWGLGASLGFPVAVSIAGENPDRPAQRVGAVATAGYLAFLVGPPSLGLLGERYGLRTAILAVVALLLIGAVAFLVRARLERATRHIPYDEPGAGRVREGAHR